MSPSPLKLVWATDTHFDHVPVSIWEQWIADVLSQTPDGLLITGDISEGEDVVVQLKRLARATNFPIYFVLGNHDFYRSSIAATRRDVIAACRQDDRLCYLTDVFPIELSNGVFLIGEDGWGDASVGDFDGSSIRLNDFTLIDDFSKLPKEHWKDQLLQLGLESAERLETKLSSLPGHAREVLVLTHVPPFREACWYEGHTTDDHWAPFFVCGEVGKVLRLFSASRPDTRVKVLCGHTHHEGIATIAENLIVYTGAAVYGQPALEAVLEIDSDSIRIT